MVIGLPKATQLVSGPTEDFNIWSPSLLTFLSHAASPHIHPSE